MLSTYCRKTLQNKMKNNRSPCLWPYFFPLVYVQNIKTHTAVPACLPASVFKSIYTTQTAKWFPQTCSVSFLFFFFYTLLLCISHTQYEYEYEYALFILTRTCSTYEYTSIKHTFFPIFAKISMMMPFQCNLFEETRITPHSQPAR